MSDHHDEEVKGLNSLVVRLANEIDYKNHLLMEKEGLSLEKFASISSLLEEKDRLLEERSAVIGTLMAEKYRLHEAFVEEKRKFEYMKLHMEKKSHDSGAQKQKLDQKTIECDIATNDEGVGMVTTNLISTRACSKSSKINLIVRANEQDGFNTKHNNEDKYLIVKEEKLEKQHLKEHTKNLEAQLDILKKELEEQREKLRQIESVDQTLRLEEYSRNEELLAAKREAINCLLTMDGNGAKIGIKRMGEIDPQPFRDVCSKKFRSGNWEEKSEKLYATWKENISDASWNPFKKEIISGKLSEVVDENDKRLTDLRKEWGEEAYRAVVDALVDLNEYNSGMRYPIPELWNFDEGRRAYLKEVLRYIIQHWEYLKKKDTEQSAAIIELMAEKERIMKRLKDINILMGEKDKLLSEKYAALGKLMAQDAQKAKLIDKLSATVSTLTANKDDLRETCNSEKRKTWRMKQQIEKLNHELQCQKEERGKQTDGLKEMKGNNDEAKETRTVKMQSEDWCFGSSSDQVEPLSTIFENFKAQNAGESEKKLQDQTMGESNKALKPEPDVLGKQPEEKCDVLGVLQPFMHPQDLSFEALISTPSHSMTWERIYQMAFLENEGPKPEI